MSVRATGLAGSALAALLPSLATGVTINGLGDSMTQLSTYQDVTGSLSSLTQSAKGGRSFLQWAESISGGRLRFDMSKGYGGPINGILKTLVIAGGAGYTAPTIAFNQGATATLQMAGGVITGVTMTGAGNGTSTFAPVITDSTGSGAVLSVVTGGHGTFGTNGSKTADMVARLPDVLANPPDLLTVLGGYNDVVAAVPYATIVGNLKTIYETCMRAGIGVIALPPLPESTLTTTQRQALARVRTWVRGYCAQMPFANPGNLKRIVLADAGPIWTDGTTAAGTSIGGTAGGLGAVTVEGTHPSQYGAKLLGQIVWQAAQALIGPAFLVPSRPASHADSFDSVLNPGGYASAYNASPIFVGTDQAATATIGSVSVTGSKPQDWLITRNAGSAAGTLVMSVESPYASDGRVARRPVLTFSLGSGTASEQWQFATGQVALASFGAIAGTGNQLLTAAEILAGYWEALCEFELAGTIAAFTGVSVFWSDTVNGVYHRGGADQGGSALARVLNASDQQPLTKLLIRTQPAKLHGNVSKLGLGVLIGFDASGAAGSATAIVKINYLGMRKVGAA